MTTAKLFWSGRSQALRLPKEFRFDGTEVIIRRQGNKVILEAAPSSPATGENEWAWLDKLSGSVDADFEAAALEEMPQQDRPELDTLFK